MLELVRLCEVLYLATACQAASKRRRCCPTPEAREEQSRVEGFSSEAARRFACVSVLLSMCWIRGLDPIALHRQGENAMRRCGNHFHRDVGLRPCYAAILSAAVWFVCPGSNSFALLHAASDQDDLLPCHMDLRQFRCKSRANLKRTGSSKQPHAALSKPPTQYFMRHEASNDNSVPRR